MKFIFTTLFGTFDSKAFLTLKFMFKFVNENLHINVYMYKEQSSINFFQSLNSNYITTFDG
jgi:hypothetical protein